MRTDEPVPNMIQATFVDPDDADHEFLVTVLRTGAIQLSCRARLENGSMGAWSQPYPPTTPEGATTHDGHGHPHD